MRLLAIDPGEKRIGVAISDESASLARPLQIISHTARLADAALIAQVARDHQVARIIVGQSFGLDGKPNVSGRRAARLAAAIRTQTDIPVELWDEDFTTADTLQVRRALGTRDRSAHIDDRAAAAILQSYLDAHR
ncbi:MAG: Holliday junction resolvase RuvX [Anaerolineae bacterium]|nr:MAG: Holliday junction resolvase RuvX [Anaerolineae bacterium]